jgi:hypothetical protein
MKRMSAETRKISIMLPVDLFDEIERRAEESRDARGLSGVLVPIIARALNFDLASVPRRSIGRPRKQRAAVTK